MGVGPLCRLFGKSRQAFYNRNWDLSEQEQIEIMVVELIRQVRRELPGLGGQKIYKCIYQPLRTNNLKVGRDKMFTIMRKYHLLIDRKKRSPKTTQSHHWFRRYPNLIKEFVPSESEQLWVADITYICIGYDFNYLSLITDAHSKKIMGYCLHPYLNNEGTVKALRMAFSQRTKTTNIIHHSDRGVQYCSFDYVDMLRKNNCSISMTENGEAYENAIAERVNGILKTEFNLSQVFRSRTDALITVQRSINAYNNLRPHMSCNYLTPNQAHLTTEPLVKHWKNRRKNVKEKKVKEIVIT